ncbi:hypothetical protein LAZ40_06625 [Cereibacter sphaeroides]|uniref:hypothetical protein n=1 Tax=Cereibacter sphaeroides TaxID=1063 RepID=UPI001F1C6AF4|nr:hypothetical protein [Cereibacter sphaeroides]MCE6958720.1 hypothetical protein [Cereibacter sphaeroides]MCE6971208.1 hypothetical protein [Cereibacter sphaeroides]
MGDQDFLGRVEDLRLREAGRTRSFDLSQDGIMVRDAAIEGRSGEVTKSGLPGRHGPGSIGGPEPQAAEIAGQRGAVVPTGETRERRDAVRADVVDEAQEAVCPGCGLTEVSNEMCARHIPDPLEFSHTLEQERDKGAVEKSGVQR